MSKKLSVIGIDSLDPHIIARFREQLPNFSKMIDQSPTFISQSIFPVDTIPAWNSIYTGLKPENHGALYVYDVFDPNLSDLHQLDTSNIREVTFWDRISNEGLKTAVIYPMLMYPAWDINGVMVSKSPFDKRINWLETEIEIDTFPKSAKSNYNIPETLKSLWGGFPGQKSLEEWSNIGKQVLEKEKEMGMNIYNRKEWDFFFIYFSLLDIIQHRLWRFFDENDPTYPGKTNLKSVILDYYKFFDDLLGEMIRLDPERGLMVISDHGHKIRPIKTVNINEYLKREKYLFLKGKNRKIYSKMRVLILETANKLNLEHFLIKLIVKNKRLTKMSKSVYSSSGSIDTNKSVAYLSNFAGMKSYSYGGIEINRELVSEQEYERIREKIISTVLQLNTDENLINFIDKRENLFKGKFTKEIFPDIVFELKPDYCVGWDMNSDLKGRSYDHNVASGGHGKDAVFLVSNFEKTVKRDEISLIDIAPTILDYFNINYSEINFDGASIFGEP